MPQEESEVTNRAHECASVPELLRLNYFFGQMLGVKDFQSEQSYFREKMKLHNRCLHGYGTVCGLLVRPAPPQKRCEPESDEKRRYYERELRALENELAAQVTAVDVDPDNNANVDLDKSTAAAGRDPQRLRAEIEQIKRLLEKLPPECPMPPVRPKVVVECGIALDCEGNEIVVRREETVDLWARLSRDERKELERGRQHVYLSICFCEKPASPVRPLRADSCDSQPECTFGMLQDAYSFRVSLHKPERDERCEPCCSECSDSCLLLARVDCAGPEGNVELPHIENRVRRQLTRYESTRIVGINWTHGAHYWIEEADDLLGGSYSGDPYEGLVFKTSRPIRAATLRPGVVDVWVIRGGGGPHGDFYSLDVEIKPIHEHDGFVREFHVRYTGDELLDNGDRVLIFVRGEFILDACCQPLDAVNVGGLVPLLPGFDRFHRHHDIPCSRDVYGPPRSGIGFPGGSTFESWFYVKRRHEEQGQRHRRQGGPGDPGRNQGN